MDEIEILEESCDTTLAVGDPTSMLPDEIWTMILDYCFLDLFGVSSYFHDLILHPQSRYKFCVSDNRFPRKKLKQPYDYVPGLPRPTSIITTTKDYKSRVAVLQNIAHKVEKIVVLAPATLRAVLGMADKFLSLQILDNRTRNSVEVESCGFPRAVKLLFEPPKTWKERSEEEWTRYFDAL